MGVVTEYLIGLVAKQVEDYRLVVWYDPEAAYKEVAAELRLSSVALGATTAASPASP